MIADLLCTHPPLVLHTGLSGRYLYVLVSWLCTTGSESAAPMWQRAHCCCREELGVCSSNTAAAPDEAVPQETDPRPQQTTHSFRHVAPREDRWSPVSIGCRRHPSRCPLGTLHLKGRRQRSRGERWDPHPAIRSSQDHGKPWMTLEVVVASAQHDAE